MGLKPGKFAFVEYEQWTGVLARWEGQQEGYILVDEQGVYHALLREELLNKARPLNRAAEKFLLNLVRQRWDVHQELAPSV